jgi:hypothetical protein
MTDVPPTPAELFAVVCGTIPHHNIFRELWSGRVVRVDEFPRYVCPKCGRRLPLASASLARRTRPLLGTWTLTDTEVAMLCAVCGFAHKLAIPMSLNELDTGVQSLDHRLSEQGWDGWRDTLENATWRDDEAERAEALGETLLLIRDGLHWLRPHQERDDAMKRLAISSAVHWPHRA